MLILLVLYHTQVYTLTQGAFTMLQRNLQPLLSIQNPERLNEP